jgi:CspA family cold shock protein
LPFESALFLSRSISCTFAEIIQVAMGTVKWFNPTKGYGFIKPEAGGPDVFVHISSVEKAGYTGLAEGVRISYELVPSRSGKVSAENLRLG